MPQKDYPLLSKDVASDFPSDGLFGNCSFALVLAEVVADPYSAYRPKDIEELTGLTAPSIRVVLSHLVKIGILEKDSSDKQHPIFRANLASKRLKALTLLAYAIIDDRDKSGHMDDAILHYCNSTLKDLMQPQAIATAADYMARTKYTEIHKHTTKEGSESYGVLA